MMAIEYLFDMADYHAFVEQLGPNIRTPELMNGKFVVAQHPSVVHQRNVRGLLQAMDGYERLYGIAGEILPGFEVVLETHTVVVPDLAFIVKDSVCGTLTEERIYGAPDFVCEIASPSTRVYDAHEKFLAYLRAGVREYWLIDPFADVGARFTLYERVEKATASTMPTLQQFAGGPAQSRIFPGIAIPQALL